MMVLEKRQHIAMTRRDFLDLLVSSGMGHHSSWRKPCGDVCDRCPVLTGAVQREAAQRLVDLDPSRNHHNPTLRVQH